jgi:hypothetical protein
MGSVITSEAFGAIVNVQGDDLGDMFRVIVWGGGECGVFFFK